MTAIQPEIKTISLWQLTGLQWQQFRKRQSNWLVILMFAGAGLYGLHQGYADKLGKTNTIQAFRQEKDSLLQDMIAGIHADTLTQQGKAIYRKSSVPQSGLWNIRLPSYKLPVSTAIYNIGQSDVFTYYYLFATENFEMQWMKQTEISNPLRALAGHFDVNFWLVYLLPLFILLFTFNALSAETEGGNWRLIMAQGITQKHWMQSKFLVVGLLSGVLILFIIISGTIINIIAFRQAPAISDFLFLIMAVIYLLFWMALFYYINSLHKPTAWNALVSGVAWISICLVLPVVISKIAEVAIPVDSSEISTFSRRPQNPQIENSPTFAAGLIHQFRKENTACKVVDTDSTRPAFFAAYLPCLALAAALPTMAGSAALFWPDRKAAAAY